jgi:energy-coupling factor transporter transmembrane protein EcfT
VHDALAAARAAGITLVVTTHDPAPLLDLADATVRVSGGSVDGPPGVVGAPGPAAPGRERRGRAPSGALRTLPGSSPLHRLWAGTKVGALLALAVTLAVDPSWATLGGAAGVLLAGAVAAHLPWRAVPRPPRWLLLWLLPAVLAALGTRPPLIHVGQISLSLGGLEGLGLLVGTTLVSLLGTALLVATTPLGDFPPLLEHLARRSGSRAAVSTITLGLRLMPLLLAEGRTTWLLLGQRRHVERVPPRLRERVRHGVRTALLACSMAVRRAADMGEAINARGGFGAVAGPDQRPSGRDLLAAAMVAAILAVALAV